MRHGVSGRKLNMVTSHRLAVFRNMVTSLLQHERIFTTVPKAKELRKFAESMVTLGKRGDLHAKRQALAFIREKAVVYKLFDELAQRYQDRPGGYTRIIKVGFRRGDAAPMCIIELVKDAMDSTKKKKTPSQVEATPAQAAAPAEVPETQPLEEKPAKVAPESEAQEVK
jgi:large subunit ribosomal protein L17